MTWRGAELMHGDAFAYGEDYGIARALEVVRAALNDPTPSSPLVRLAVIEASLMDNGVREALAYRMDRAGKRN